MEDANVPKRYHNHWVAGDSKHIAGEDQYNVWNTYDGAYHYEDGWAVDGLSQFGGNYKAWVSIETKLGWSDGQADGRKNNNNNDNNQQVVNDTTVPI